MLFRSDAEGELPFAHVDVIDKAVMWSKLSLLNRVCSISWSAQQGKLDSTWSKASAVDALVYDI